MLKMPTANKIYFKPVRGYNENQMKKLGISCSTAQFETSHYSADGLAPSPLVSRPATSHTYAAAISIFLPFIDFHSIKHTPTIERDAVATDT